MTMPGEENNPGTPKRRSKRIIDWLYDFVESYGLDFVSVLIAGTGLLLYEISYISAEAIGRWTLLALLGISISNMGNRGTRIREIQRMTKESMTLVREHLDKTVLEENVARAIDEHLGRLISLSPWVSYRSLKDSIAPSLERDVKKRRNPSEFWTLGPDNWTQ